MVGRYGGGADNYRNQARLLLSSCTGLGGALAGLLAAARGLQRWKQGVWASSLACLPCM